jgi:ribosome small subunit-dependent GTPase A
LITARLWCLGFLVYARVSAVHRSLLVVVGETGEHSVTLPPRLRQDGLTSGVGKSTLINSLLGVNTQETQGIREADSRGRHTTTARYLLHAPGGAWLIDRPGMRELRIGAAQAGVDRTFVDIESLAVQCRFRDGRLARAAQKHRRKGKGRE